MIICAFLSPRQENLKYQGSVITLCVQAGFLHAYRCNVKGNFMVAGLPSLVPVPPGPGNDRTFIIKICYSLHGFLCRLKLVLKSWKDGISGGHF